MNGFVKILSDDKGETRANPTWCVAINIDGTNRTLCGGEAFGYAESGCTYIQKQTKRGGCTCEKCIRIVKEIKQIKF